MKTKVSVLLVGIAVLLMASFGQAWTRTGSDLGSRVAALEVQQAINTAAIAQNASDIADNAADIAQNAADIADNAADIAQNASDIADNAVDIATNATNIAANTTAINTHVADTGNAHSHDARYVRNSGGALRSLSGVVDSDGSIFSGVGFTIARIGVGDYRINFDTPFTNFPAVTVLGDSFVDRVDWGTDGSLDHVNVQLLDTAGALVDSDFYFIAVGPN